MSLVGRRVAGMSLDFMKKVVQGVHRWDSFEPDVDFRTIERVRSELTSLAAVASPGPLFVSGGVVKDDKTSIAFAAVSERITVSAAYSPTTSHRVTVHSNSTLERIDIHSASFTTSNVIGLAGGGPLEYVLVFGWGSVDVHRWTGTDEERAGWLEHFTGILAERT